MHASALPSPTEIARQLPGGRLRPGDRIAFQDPINPKPGERPCTMWIGSHLPDGWTVSDARKKIPDLELKDLLCKMVPALARSKSNSRNGSNGHPAGGPSSANCHDGGSPRNGGGERSKARPLQSQLVAHDAFELLTMPAPARRWHVEPWLPAADVTLLGGDGGEGKTTLAVQLAYCTAMSFPWLGKPVRAGAAVYYTAEETKDEMHYRLEQIVKVIHLPGATANPLKIISRADSEAVLATWRNDSMQPTELFNELVSVVRDTEAKLLVLDAAADVYGGDELNRSQVRSFFRLSRSLAIAQDCTVLLTAHPSVDGIKTGRGYSGSTHWNNSVRSRLYFTTPTAANGSFPDPDLRQLELAKSNRARRGEKIMLRWREGYFATEDSAAAASALNLGAAKPTFLDLLGAYTREGRNVSHTPTSPSYAPKLFAVDARAKGLSKDNLAMAMNALFAEQRIKVEPYGRPSRQYNRIVEVPGGAE